MTTIRTGADLAAARARLGLSVQELADALRMNGRHGPRHLREMELGSKPLGGPIAVAVELLLKDVVKKIDKG